MSSAMVHDAKRTGFTLNDPVLPLWSLVVAGDTSPSSFLHIPLSLNMCLRNDIGERENAGGGKNLKADVEVSEH